MLVAYPLPGKGYRYPIRRGSGLFISLIGVWRCLLEDRQETIPRFSCINFLIVKSGMERQNSMLMAKVFKWLMVLLIPLLSLTITSCGDDKDEPIESGTENAEAKKFIGTWHSDASSGGTWTFNADGTCKFSYNSTYKGEWSYSAESKVLTTTILNWNWEIYAISENSWTGKHLAGRGSTFTYSRSN